MSISEIAYHAPPNIALATTTAHRPSRVFLGGGKRLFYLDYELVRQYWGRVITRHSADSHWVDPNGRDLLLRDTEDD